MLHAVFPRLVDPLALAAMLELLGPGTETIPDGISTAQVANIK
jgi:hypothetical protein